MELRLHNPISYTLHSKLKDQSRTLHTHIQRKVQIVKLNALARRQSRKQTPRHSAQIRLQRANLNEALVIRIRGLVVRARYEIVFDNE